MARYSKINNEVLAWQVNLNDLSNKTYPDFISIGILGNVIQVLHDMRENKKIVGCVIVVNGKRIFVGEGEYIAFDGRFFSMREDEFLSKYRLILEDNIDEVHGNQSERA